MNTYLISSSTNLSLSTTRELILLTGIIYVFCGFGTPCLYMVGRHLNDDRPSRFSAWLQVFIIGDIASIILSALLCHALYQITVINVLIGALIIAAQLLVSIFTPLADRYEPTQKTR